MKDSSLRFALFGLGKFGKNYARLIPEISGASLPVIVATSSDDPNLAFQNPDIDAVIIATPPTTHFALAKTALENGKHVLMEKPMVLKISEARELVKLVKKTGLTFMVGSQYLFNESILRVKGKLAGKIDLMKSEHRQSPPREDFDVLWDAAPHPLSIHNFLFSSTRIKSASGRGQKNSAGLLESVEAVVEFDRGPKLEIITSWPGEQKVRKISWSGENLEIELDETEKKPVGAEPLRNQLECFIDCVRNKKEPFNNVSHGLLITDWLQKISSSLSSTKSGSRASS